MKCIFHFISTLGLHGAAICFLQTHFVGLKLYYGIFFILQWESSYPADNAAFSLTTFI